jgi:hypothetical protein
MGSFYIVEMGELFLKACRASLSRDPLIESLAVQLSAGQF